MIPVSSSPRNSTKYAKKDVTPHVFAAQKSHQLGSGDPVTSHVLFHCQWMDQKIQTKAQIPTKPGGLPGWTSPEHLNVLHLDLIMGFLPEL